MILNNLQKIITIVAVLLWLTAIIIITVAISNHQIWNLMPIIAYNHIQNYLGWIVVWACILSVCSPILNVISKNK